MKRRNFLSALAVLPVAGLLTGRKTIAEPTLPVDGAAQANLQHVSGIHDVNVWSGPDNLPRVTWGDINEPPQTLAAYGATHPDPMVRKFTASLYNTTTVFK